jgi:hypothetical protein
LKGMAPGESRQLGFLFLSGDEADSGATPSVATLLALYLSKHHTGGIVKQIDNLTGEFK